MSKIPIKIKVALIDALINQDDLFGVDYHEQIIEFLSEIWSLDEMPSFDPRYDTARADAIQHLVNNDDWDHNYLLKERFNLVNDDDDLFIRFINTVVQPKYRGDEDGIIRYVLLISPYLQKVGYKLVIQGSDDQERPIYEVVLAADAPDIPVDTEPNNIPFFVVKNPKGSYHRESSHDNPAEYPSFVLVYDPGWNDYSFVTGFWLFYYDKDKNVEDIGRVKISLETPDGETPLNTGDHIPETFKTLPSNYFSLGDRSVYYRSLKRIFGAKKSSSILHALRDTALFEDIQERFEKTSSFVSSLIRESTAERSLRQAKYEIYNYDLTNLYKFKYTFQPAYAGDGIEIDFSFDGALDIPSRIYAIIGKNGVGKTQLLRSLPLNISRNIDDLFIPRTPLFSRVIAVSYSAFDEFEMPIQNATFNYVYCGLKKEDGTLLTDKEQNKRFVDSARKIAYQGRLESWRVILGNFLDEDIIDRLFRPEVFNKYISDEGEAVNVAINAFFRVRKMFSSGQGIMFFIITEIVANIRFDSLLLFDEPETHLHPNAMTQLMNTIYELVNQFESYCILTTHTPLIIREILSRNVYVMEKHENVPSVRRIGVESFGENLTVLTEEVFGNKDIPKQYKMIIEKLIREGKSFEEIIELIQFGDVPVGLNTRIFIKHLIEQRND